jgi:acetyl-CoA acyltransferase
MTRAVHVIGAETGPFGRFVETSLADLARPVLLAALQDAGIAPGDIQAAYVGNGFGGLIQGQEAILGQVVLAGIGIAPVPIHTIKNACSSGSDAAHLAWAAIAYGQYECVLVLGVEKMTHADKTRAIAALATASDRVPTDGTRSVFMDLNAERAQRYMAAYGATKRHFAMVAVKNRQHAMLNEKASVRTPLTVEQVMEDRVVIEPLTRAMCGGIADGAAAIVLASDDFMRRHGLKGPKMLASAVVSGDPTGALSASATARAAALAFEQSGIAPSDVSMAEVHDPTAPQEFLDIEDIGLCGRGESIRLLEEGAIALGGRIPVNVSGGLTSRGHPVGATGVAQIAEIAHQLQGRAGASQVEGARIGLAQMAGGLLGRDSAIATVHILGQ